MSESQQIERERAAPDALPPFVEPDKVFRPLLENLNASVRIMLDALGYRSNDFDANIRGALAELMLARIELHRESPDLTPEGHPDRGLVHAQPNLERRGARGWHSLPRVLRARG